MNVSATEKFVFVKDGSAADWFQLMVEKIMHREIHPRRKDPGFEYCCATCQFYCVCLKKDDINMLVVDCPLCYETVIARHPPHFIKSPASCPVVQNWHPTNRWSLADISGVERCPVCKGKLLPDVRSILKTSLEEKEIRILNPEREVK